MTWRRALAVLVLLIVSGFVLGAAWDPCDDEGSCTDECHAACAGGCAAALLVTGGDTGMAADARDVTDVVPLTRPLSRAAEPEPRPPRG